MKRNTLLHVILIVVAALTSACKSNETDELSTNKGEKTINFCVANYKQYPMDDVLQGNEADSRYTRSTAAIPLKHLIMAVFDTEGGKYKEVKQEAECDGYGTFSLTLNNGNYTIMFFGYNGDQEVEISSPTDIHFADGYVPNCFCKAIPLTVNENTQATQAIVLERPIACFTLQCLKENLPDNFAYLNSTIEGCGVRLNALTGLATQIETRVYNQDITQSQFVPGPVNFNLYCFLPATEHRCSFTITALDINGNEIKTRTFNDVPMKINQKTIYTGNFFVETDDPADNAGACFTLTLDNHWDEITIPF